MLALAVLALLALAACSGDDDGSDPVGPGATYDSQFADVSFNDFGAYARQILPPVYQGGKASAVDIWHDGDFPILGKVFSQDEPMSIHRNIDDHDMVMQEIEGFLDQLAMYEEENDTLPDGPIEFDDPEYGSGSIDIRVTEVTAPIPVPAVCQTVFDCTEVAVDYVMQVSVTSTQGDFESPYFGFTMEGDTEVVYYWGVGRGEDGQPDGTQLFMATRDVASESVEIAGAYFKPDGPGDEDRCNWVYRLSGNAEMEFTYNMGWYSESPAFELFACVQGSGDKDTEFGLRYHQYTDTSGWDTLDETWLDAQIFGPVGDDPYAFIAEDQRSGTIEDYVDQSVMFVREDSPLADIPNPFAGVFDQ
jgi:hypothetical protein